MSTSGFYRWKNEGYRPKSEDFEVDLITLIHEAKKEKAGIRTIKMILERDFNLKMNLKKIKRIKRERKLVTKKRVRSKNHTPYHLNEEHVTVPNLLKQNFSVSENDRVYSVDISYLDYHSDKRAYLFAVKDLCTKEIVHSSLSRTLVLDEMLSRFESFLTKLPLVVRKKLIVHSDQGGHFTCERFRKMLKKMRVVQSMSRKGNCLDNAPIESFFGHMKDEAEIKRCRTFEELEIEIKEYIDYYNNKRPQWGLKRKTPAECRGLSFGVFY